MSLEEIWESEFTIPFILVMCLLLIPVIFIVANQQERNVYERRGDAPAQQRTATVITKYTAPNPYNPQMRVNMATFEFDNGTRKSLAIKGISAYGAIMEGDKGILEYAGDMFIRFERK